MELKKQVFHVTLDGISDILFDPFKDHSKEVRPPDQKLPLTGDNQLVFPAENVRAFLVNQKKGGVIRFVEKRQAMDFLSYAETCIRLDPPLVPFMRNGKPVQFEKFNADDPDWPLYVFTSAPSTKGANGQTVKQEAIHRPALRLPWSLSLEVTLFENPKINAAKLHSWFEIGGMLVAIGAYRPRFGRFTVEWKKIN